MMFVLNNWATQQEEDALDAAKWLLVNLPGSLLYGKSRVFYFRIPRAHSQPGFLRLPAIVMSYK